jgi:thiamine kinase-like enzyme
MQPKQIAERVWPDGVQSIEPLGGGITNRNFKVTTSDGAFVLRIGGKDTELLGIDRDNEHEATRVAAAAGLAPDVVAFLQPEGYLVTRFVDGRPVPLDEVRRPETLAEIAASLRMLHDGTPISGRFDAFRVVETYREIAAARDVEPPHDFAEAKEVADHIERLRGEQPLCPCHNDLLNANFIRDGTRIWIVDWEYAGMGDRFFDLANFSVNHELNDDESAELLRSYFGDVRADDVRVLRLMRFMSDFREAMWGVVQQAISELDFDFEAYANEHFERLQRTAQNASFQAAFEASR